MILKASYETETEEKDGYYVISQYDSSEGKTSSVWLLPHQVDALIVDMKDFLQAQSIREL